MADPTTQPNQPLFGTPAVSPSALDMRRKLAAALQMQGQDASPIRSPWQGVGRIVQSAMGGYEGYQADQAELAARKESAKNLAAALQGNNVGGAIGAISDPFTNPEAAKLAVGLMTPQMIDTGLGVQARDRYGNPVGPFIPKTMNAPEEYGPGTRFNQFYQGTPGGGITPMQPSATSINPTSPPGGVPQPQAQPNVPAPQGQGGIMPGGGQIISGPGSGPSASQAPIDPMTQAKIQLAQQMQADMARKKAIAEKTGELQMSPVEEAVNRYKAAPETIQNLGVIEDVARSEMAKGRSAATTGMAGDTFKQLRQTVNGIAGSEVLGETAGLETMSKMNGALAGAIAKGLSARGATQYEFKTIMNMVPGNLQNSWRGTLYLANLFKQVAQQDMKLGPAMLQNPGNAMQIRDQFYKDPANQIVDPYTGNRIDINAAGAPGGAGAAGAVRTRRWNPVAGSFESVGQ